jgi:SEC-C motif
MNAKIGRNQLCPCGSRLKFKKCHGWLGDTPPRVPALSPPGRSDAIEHHRASDRIRETQQGLGRPIIGWQAGDHQMVAVGNTLYYSTNWKTFPDFLADYIKEKLEPDWGNAEIAKPWAERHPIVQWYDAYCRYQQATIKNPGDVSTTTVTGVVACYLGLAYSLYLLDHNIELQTRLIRRLKDPANFQGAYYELFVANTLIRAGFTLTLENEADGTSKHCEFAAISKRTGKTYWVEAKMRAIAGLFGKTERDGGIDGNPLVRLISHLKGALAKPAANERLIFIDLNTEPQFEASGRPDWHDAAVARLEQYEASELPSGMSAYVFVTNIAFHRRLAEEPRMVAVPFGLGMPDFNRPGYYRLSDVWRQKQKHSDAHQIGEALAQYPRFPATFNGSLPSEAFGDRVLPLRVGQTYIFQEPDGTAAVGVVTSPTVSEPEKRVYFVVTDAQGRSQIRSEPMSEAQLADYKAHPDAYFGRIASVQKKIEDRYEMFEWLMEANKGLSRSTLLERCIAWPRFEELKELSDPELLAEYCEGMVGAFEAAGIQAKTGRGLARKGIH